jgi:glycosyltransferase involved in cell wall biosynthesis
MKILHIINSLKKGGAEGNLYRLCIAQKKKYKNKIDITIITLINNGYYENKLKAKGVKIISLGIDKKIKIFGLIKKISKFRNIIIKKNQDIIQSWMYHSNFLTLFIPRQSHNKIFWNIRHSELNFNISKKITILISIICGLSSRIVPKKIIYCSEKSIKFHENKHFYSKNKTSLIENGYSERTYYPSNSLRFNFRKKNNIKKKKIIFGFAGRYAKQKNIDSLLLGFSKISNDHDNIYLYMAGKDINSQNQELINIASRLNIKNKVFFINEQKNLVEFYNGIDVLILTSHSESFPNVIAEAMLCTTPVLSSNAGCSKKIIDKYGFVLSQNDYLSISKGIKKIINKLTNQKFFWKSLKKNTRLQIINNFSIEKMAENYLRNWIF